LAISPARGSLRGSGPVGTLVFEIPCSIFDILLELGRRTKK
jgi:hypothetical protein